jgi:hypothetical protein
MKVAYWIVAALLALFYLYSGGIKVVRSPDRLRSMMGWIDAVPLRLVRTIGLLEVLGALGLILPLDDHRKLRCGRTGPQPPVEPQRRPQDHAAGGQPR